MPNVVSCETFLSSPLIPSYTRRGDPFGWRSIADGFADSLAPGLSGRTWEATWLLLLPWCLVVAQRAKPEKHDPWPWVRPLELFWCAQAARGLDGKGNGRQIPGIQYLSTPAPWDDKRWNQSADQWERRRSTGIYGSYRTLLRAMPGFTLDDDGWRPGNLMESVAEKVQAALHASCWMPGRADGRGNQDGASFFKELFRKLQTQKSWFPPRPLHHSRLPSYDGAREILRGLVFWGDTAGRRRAAIVARCSRFRGDHSALCAELEAKAGQLAGLKRFTRLADAATAALGMINSQISEDQKHPLAVVAAIPTVERALLKVEREAKAWKRATTPSGLAAPRQFAESIIKQRSRPRELLRTILRQHTATDLGGLRTLGLADDGERITRISGRAKDGIPDYRFRLWHLNRLAVQLGEVETMGNGVEAVEVEPGEDL